MASFFSGKYFLTFLILVLVISSDQQSKFLFTTTCNPGIAFNLLQSLGSLNIILSFAILAGAAYFLVKQKTRLMIVAVSLVLGGGLSNIADRIVFGCVRDFIDLKYWPSFNLADSAVTIGVAFIIFILIMGKNDSRV